MYKPSQRRVPVEILAAAGWVSGILHVPAKTPLVSFLNKESTFLPLTGVPADPSTPEMDFLAVRRLAVLLVIPHPIDIELHPHAPPGRHVDVRLRCLFAAAQVEGTASVLGGQRASDFLETSPDFIPLEGCGVTSDDGPRDEEFPHVIVNAKHVLAVADLSRPRSQAEEPVLAGERQD